MASESGTLSETYIQDCFHSYLRSSLAQAKAERLLDVDVLASAEADLMITGPALCLYFAAIRCTTLPPSVPLPRLDKSMPPAQLAVANCPPAYAPILRVWADTVEPIQALPPERQHDLARLVCGMPALIPGRAGGTSLPRLAADLRAVAIEISQRRTFQERYAGDLQAAIDGPAVATGPSSAAASPGGSRLRASFEPPPAYEPSPAPSPRTPAADLPPAEAPLRPSRRSPRVVNPDLPPVEPLHVHKRTTSASAASPGGVPGMPTPVIPGVGAGEAPLLSPQLLSPSWSASSTFASQQSEKPLPVAPTPGSPSGSPSWLDPSVSPAIALIRETLYAALADVLERTPFLRALLVDDPPRAYYASVALAALGVAESAVTPSGAFVGVLGARLEPAQAPAPLRPLVAEIGAIAAEIRALEEADSDAAVAALGEGAEPALPRMDRVRNALLRGAGAQVPGADADGRPSSQDGTALALANRLNALAIRVLELRPFRERQAEVFKVLAGVGG